VSAPTVKEYFSILEDTMIGFMVPAYKKVVKRRLIQASRFYYSDVGITNYLLRRGNIQQGSPEYGRVFEQFIIQELHAYVTYNECDPGLFYWRTASGYEVDAILGEAKVAVEIKSAREIFSHHTRGLRALGEEYPNARKIIVSNERNKRLMGDIEIFPAEEFLTQLWSGEVI
jgi:predicted AAA+ superfamily ATPase